MRFRRDIKGFTLGELLTVVMIIGILVGFALPVYANQIEKSREDNDISLVRAAYTEVYVASLNGDFSKRVEVKLSQTVYDWQYHDTITFNDIYEGELTFNAEIKLDSFLNFLTKNQEYVLNYVKGLTTPSEEKTHIK